MIRLLKRLIVVSTIITITNSCNQKPQTFTKKRVTVKYTNGKTYCDGFHSINSVGVAKNRVGVWKFFYPNGTLETFYQYNEEGEIINCKDYGEDGKMIYSQTINGNITNTISYYENGKISSESILQTIVKKGEEDNYEETHETEKLYYLNGQLYYQQLYKDGVLQGIKNIWDTSGNLVLTIKYDNGLIVDK